MVQKIIFKLIAFAVIVLMSLATVQVAVASESSHATTTSTPDVQVIIGTTGHKVSGATVMVDGTDAGKTDSKGNLSLKESLTGNHTVTVSMKGINNTTVTADFTHKPVVVMTSPEKYTLNLTMHITDKATKQSLAGVKVINNQFYMGTTDANGDLVIDGFPQGLYLLDLEKDGYKPSKTVMVFFSNKKPQNFTMTAGTTETKH